MNPRDAYVYGSRAFTLAQKGNLAQALADVDRAIDITPEEPVFHVTKADIQRRRGDLPAALASYDQVLKLDPNSTDAYREKADIYRKIGDNEGELASLSSMIVVAPSNQYALLLRAFAYEKQGRLDLALKDYDALIALNPSDQFYKDRSSQLRKAKDRAGPPPVPPVIVDEASAKGVAQSPEAAPGKEAERTPSKLDCRVFVAGANLTISVPCAK